MQHSFFRLIKSIILFSIPIVVGQLSQMLISVGDLIVAAKHSTSSVAAIGVSTGLSNPIFLFGFGLLAGISPYLSKKRGEKKDINQIFFTSLIYGLGIGIAISIICFLLLNLIPYLNLSDDLGPLCIIYLKVVIFSFPFVYIFQVCKEFLQAKDRIIFPNLISFLAVILNYGLNFILVFGFNDFKGIGFEGLAYASLIIRIAMCLAILLYCFKEIHTFNILKQELVSLFRFNLPIALMFFLEVTAFCLISILSGKINKIEAASSNIIMNIAALSFMIPMSLGQVGSTKVGFYFGEKNLTKIKEYIFGCLILCFLFALFSSSFLYFFKADILSYFTTDEQVLKVALSIMTIIAVFQFPDSFQVTLIGILRGLGLNTVSTYSVLISQWFIGLPFGIYFCYYQGYKSFGLWLGVAIGLTSICAILIIICKREYNKLFNQKDAIN